MHLLRLGQILGDFSLFLLGFFVLTIICFLFISKIYRSKASGFLKNLFIALFFGIVCIAFFFISFEFYYRYIYDDSDALGFLLTNQHWLDKHVIYNNYFFRDDKQFQIQEKPGVTRIGVVGDSLAFGYGISNVKDRFSDLLEADLNKAGKHVEVYNMGRPGLDTCGEIPTFDKIKFIHFDIIVWSFFINDIQPCGHSTGSDIITSVKKPTGFVGFLEQHSFFFNFMYWRLCGTHQKVFAQAKFADLDQYKNPVAVKLEEDSIATFSAMLKQDGNTKVVGLIFPLLFLMGPNYPGKEAESWIKTQLTQNGVSPVIDLLPLLINKNPNDITANQFDWHPNEAVHKMAADQLYKAILPLLK